MFFKILLSQVQVFGRYQIDTTYTMYLYVYLSICLSMYISTYVHTCLSMHLFITINFYLLITFLNKVDYKKNIFIDVMCSLYRDNYMKNWFWLFY